MREGSSGGVGFDGEALGACVLAARAFAAAMFGGGCVFAGAGVAVIGGVLINGCGLMNGAWAVSWELARVVAGLVCIAGGTMGSFVLLGTMAGRAT